MGKILILDIDGVLNPFDGHSNHELTKISVTASHSVHMNLQMIQEFLRKLNESHVEVVWGSAWESNSNLLLDSLNIEKSLRWIPIQNEDVGLGTWKIKSIRPWVDQELVEVDQLAWVDDELEQDAFEWAQQRGNTLAMCTDAHVGLTSQHIENIYEFFDIRENNQQR